MDARSLPNGSSSGNTTEKKDKAVACSTPKTRLKGPSPIVEKGKKMKKKKKKWNAGSY